MGDVEKRKQTERDVTRNLRKEKSMELKVNQITIPQEVKWNYEELKQEIAERAHDYEMMVYTDDQIKTAKEDRANLNKLKKTLNDERIRLEKEYMKPFNTFKAQVNEVISIIDKPVGIIDRQIKEYEEEQKEEKRTAIYKYLDSYKMPYDINLRQIFKDKWLNATVAMKTIYQEVDEMVGMIQSDIEVIEDLEDYQSFAITFYSQTLNLTQTLGEIKRQKDFRAMQEKVEAEQKAKNEPKNEPKPEVKEDVKPKQEWVAFKAFLSVDQARMLKAFFNDNNIEFTTI